MSEVKRYNMQVHQIWGDGERESNNGLCAVLGADYDALHQRLDAQISYSESISTDRDKLKAERDDLAAESQRLTQRLEAADEWATLASEQLLQRDRLAAELQRLQADIATIRADRDAFGNNAIDLRREVEGLRAELAALKGGQVAVAWAFRHHDGSINDPSAIEHSVGMIPLYTHPAQQPGQDVAGLVEALKGMLEYFPEGHSDGECFSIEAARWALAAHDKQSGEVKP